MTTSLANQKVLILGGSGQMGAATARAVAGFGASVTLVGRSESKLQKVAEDIGAKATTLVADLSTPEVVSNLLKETKPDHVVVGVSSGASASDKPGTPVGDAQRAFGRFWISYVVLQTSGHLPDHGSVTLLSGSSARTPALGHGVWSTLHGSIEALARAATLEVAPVRVNVVSPGGIGLPPDRQLVRRRGTADDLGQAIASLITNPAITGTILDVDSGERKGTWSGT